MGYVYAVIAGLVIGAGGGGFLAYKYGRMIEAEFQAGLRKL